MTARYNPHKLQKITRSWKTSQNNCLDLANDIFQRELIIWNKDPFEWQMPIHYNDTIVSNDLFNEYGHDTCRMAAIMSFNNKSSIESILETCHKWISKFHEKILNTTNKPFTPEVWIKASCKAKDYIQNQNRIDLAISALKAAIKLSPPSIDMKFDDRILVLTTLYPFFPIISGFFLIEAYRTWPTSLNLKALLEEKYQHCKPIKFAINKSGWYWEVVTTNEFISNPKVSFEKIPWFSNATKGKDFDIKIEQEGHRICLKI